MNIPTLQQAEAYLAEAETLNPGPWTDHSRHAAIAAAAIAQCHPELDPGTAYILGLLHDIGRREGITDMRHALDGYNFMLGEGYPDAARICMTHSFPIPKIEAFAGGWGHCSEADLDFVRRYLAEVEFTPYDRLIQLCDTLALPSGTCLMEKRFVDVVMRYGFNDYTLEKWRAFIAIQQEFDAAIGRSIYSVLPGVVENSFAGGVIGRHFAGGGGGE
ncbi:MAG: HD domain-containing protein [Chloroflexota bacterium]|nr:HD domain-containing protein [Pseudomonadota bacterium]